MVDKNTNIAERLAMIQLALRCPKDKRNNFAGFDFRNAAGILEKVKPLLNETRTALVMTDEIVQVGERYYLKAIVTIINCDNPKDYYTASAMAREQLDKKGNDQAQVTGAASSYARKYALCGLFAIDDSSLDPDETSGKDSSVADRDIATKGKDQGNAKPTAEAKPKNQLAVKAFAEWCSLPGSADLDQKELKAAFGAYIGETMRKSAKDLTDEDWSKVIGAIKDAKQKESK